MVKFDFHDTPTNIVDYLKNKQLALTYNHKELLKQAHDKAFTVAKITRMDLLNDVHDSLLEAKKSGANFETWKKDIIPTLEKKGWWGTKDIVSNQGEVKTVVIDSRRLKNIYDTNMRISYQKHRYEEMMKLPLSEYWMYRSALLDTSRPTHTQKHGLVFHRNHSFWKKNYPPNDWGCQCTVTAHSKRDLEKRDIPIVGGKVEDIAGTDWDYNIGQDTNLASLKKINLDASLEKLPLLNKVRNNELKEVADDNLKKLFFTTLGVKPSGVLVDKTNDPLYIDDSIFKTSQGQSKIKKRERHLYLYEIAETIKNPDEIYLESRIGNISKANSIYKKMFRYINDDGKKRAIVVIFEYLKDKTVGVSAYFLDNGTQVEKRRIEKLVYKRESD